MNLSNLFWAAMDRRDRISKRRTRNIPITESTQYFQSRFHFWRLQCILWPAYFSAMLFGSNINITTGETSQAITSRHFSSLLFTFMSILTSLALNQLKGKYNTHTHIQQLNISLHFSSLHTLTSIVNWKAKTIQIY